MSITEKMVMNAYEIAKERFALLGVDTEQAMKRLSGAALSLHCWQGDDVSGFERKETGLTGGIAATGNYPGRARNAEELRADMECAMRLIPGPLKVNLHASYLEDGGRGIDRNKITPEHFAGWADWAVENKIGLDFNPTYFSHEKSADGYTLSSRDTEIRKFWIEHGKRCRKIGEYFGRRTGITCVTNIWIPDGAKDTPADRLSPRRRLMESLDEILREEVDKRLNKDAVESKLFGIGSESYVVGSHEFYTAYALKKGIIPALDIGHFHPTETVSNKISALLLFADELLLHLSRPVRWDSDHVVALDDELQAVMREVVVCDAENRVNIALDYFDASINRVAAWIIGARNARKALLRAFLEPTDALMMSEAHGDLTAVLATLEELKAMPWQAVWDYYCMSKDIPAGVEWMKPVLEYEHDVQLKRDLS